jgi:hypothetical protein
VKITRSLSEVASVKVPCGGVMRCFSPIKGVHFYACHPDNHGGRGCIYLEQAFRDKVEVLQHVLLNYRGPIPKGQLIESRRTEYVLSHQLRQPVEGCDELVFKCCAFESCNHNPSPNPRRLRYHFARFHRGEFNSYLIPTELISSSYTRQSLFQCPPCLNSDGFSFNT